MSTLRGKPGSVLWLMGHELRLFWRRGKVKPKTGIILISFLMAIWLLATWGIFHSLGPVIPPPPFNETPLHGLALLGVSVAIAFIASVMVSQAILGAVDAIYTRNDLDLLLSSPLSAWRVLIVRSSAIAIGALPLYAGLLGPPLLWMAIYSSPLWLSSIVFLFTLAFAATGVALLVVTALFRLIGPKNTRVLAQIFSALAGAAVFLSFQYFNISGRNMGRMEPEELAALVTQMHIDPKVWWLFPAQAFTGEIGSILIWVALAAILFPVGVFIFSRSFVADAAAASGMGQRRRATDTRVAAVRGGGLIRSVVRKEFRLLTRDPLLLSQIGLQLVYLLPLGFVLVRINDSGMAISEATFAPALTLLSSALSGSLIWITVSAEDAPDLIASAPVATTHVDRAKLIAAVGPVWLAMLIPLVALWVRNWHVGAWATAGVLIASTCSALIGLWRRHPGSRRDFVRRRQGGSLVSSLGQTFIALSLAGAIAAGSAGYPWISLIPGILAFAILGALYKSPPGMAQT